MKRLPSTMHVDVQIHGEQLGALIEEETAQSLANRIAIAVDEWADENEEYVSLDFQHEEEL